MRQTYFGLSAVVLASASLVASLSSSSIAAESGFVSYGLGTSAFSAGVTPPPGTYVSGAATYFEGDIGGNLTFGGVSIDVDLEARELISGSLNLFYVPETTFLGGSPGVSVTVPFGYLDIRAQVTGPLGNTVELQTDGFGAMDMVPRVQLGWHHDDFHHGFYVQGLCPPGAMRWASIPTSGSIAPQSISAGPLPI